MFYIFEQPWTLLIAGILALVVILIAHRIWPGNRRLWQWLIPILLITAGFGLDLLVQTDAEKIKAVIKTGVKAVEEENPDVIEAIISDNYSDSYHPTKEALVSHCRARLSEPLVDKSYKTILEIDISPPTATVIFTVRIVFDKQSYAYQGFKRETFTKTKLDLQKEPGNRWLISRAEILEIDRHPANWKQIGQIRR